MKWLGNVCIVNMVNVFVSIVILLFLVLGNYSFYGYFSMVKFVDEKFGM